MARFILGAVAVLITIEVHAAQTVSQQTFALDRADVIEINGYHGNVTVTGNSESEGQGVTVKIINVSDNRASQGNLRQPNAIAAQPKMIAKKEGKVLQIGFDADFSAEDWAQFLSSNQWPTAHIEISGSPRAVEVSWRSGPIAIKGWNERIAVDSPKSSVSVEGGENDVEISTVDGNVKVSDRKGGVKVVSHDGSQELSNVSGAVSMENFSGGLELSNTSGDLNLLSFDGKTKVKGHKGPIQFSSQKATMSFVNLNDQLKGTNDSGEVTIEADSSPSIFIKSKEGSVTLRAPNSGAFVVASSLEGMVSTPSHFETYRGSDVVQRSGRLRGEHPGRYVIRSEKGLVRVQ